MNVRRLRLVLASMVAVAVVLLPGVTIGAGASLPPLQPAADAYTDASQPAKNFGKSPTLRVDAVPATRTFIKFDLRGYTGTVTSATLRVYANTKLSGGGLRLWSVADDSWTETGITASNAPPLGTQLGSVQTTIAAGSWLSFDVTSAVATGEQVTFALDSTNGTALSMSSKEGAQPPQLVIDTTGDAPPPPVCANDSGSGLGITTTVCINAPADGQTLSADTAVTGTARVTSGSLPQGTSLYVRFFLDGKELLSAFSSSGAFTLPVHDWKDGPHTLSAAAWLPNASNPDGTNSSDYITPAGSGRAAVSLMFATGATSDLSNGNSWQPTSGTTPASGQPFVVAAVGDGAGGDATEGAVVDEIAGWNPNLLLYLGDVYQHGTTAEFTNYYDGSSFYGRFRSITDPTIGNHEYGGDSVGGSGYFNYWQTTKHYYSFDAAGWHFISLDANNQWTGPGSGAGIGSDQYNWLKADLANDTAACTVAFWHQPLWNSGIEPPATNMQPIWNLLVVHGGVTVLNGHDHDYQRFPPMGSDGTAMTNGVPEIVVGTGGHSTQQVGLNPTPAPPLVAFGGTYGALRLTITSPTAGRFEYFDTNGTSKDNDPFVCTPRPVDTTPPTAPSSLTATAQSPTSVGLSWQPSTDDSGVIDHYEIFRNGTDIGSTTQTTYTDTTAGAGTTYAYSVTATDAAGNTSAASNTATVSTPPAGQPPFFTDDFEAGLGNWTNVNSSMTLTSDAYSGASAALEQSTSAATWAWHAVPAQTDLYYRIRFKLEQPLASNAYLIKVRTGTGASIGGVYLTPSGTSPIGFRNDVAGTSTSGKLPALGSSWHTLELHLAVGASGTLAVWVDGSLVSGLNLTGQNLGTTPMGRIQIGDNSGGRTYSIALDDVAASTSFVN